MNLDPYSINPEPGNDLHLSDTELLRNTTDLGELNRILKQSERRLRLALKSAGIGLWVWNSSDTQNSGDWSDRLKEIFGLPLKAEVTHEMFLNAIHAEDRDRVNQAVMDALAGKNGGGYQAQYRTIRQEDGVEHWVEARGRAFFDAAGRAVRFVGTVLDITESKHAEESAARQNRELEKRITERTADLQEANRNLSRSQDALRIAIDTIPSLVWSSVPDGHIDYLNKRWLDYTGLTLAEASGWGWQAAVHAEDLPGLVAYWETLLQTGVQGQYEARMRRHDGLYRWFLFQGVPLHDETGKLIKWYGINTDIDARRASEHVAQGQLKAIKDVLGILAEETDPEKWLEHVLRMVSRQLGGVGVSVWERNRGDELELIATLEEDKLGHLTGDEFSGKRPSFSGKGHPVWSEMLAGGAVCVLSDFSVCPPRIRLLCPEDSPWHASHSGSPNEDILLKQASRLVSQGIRMALNLPMVVAGEVKGMLSIRFGQQREFRGEEIELARALVHQGMLALQIRKLSWQSRQSAVEAERLRLARDIHDTIAQGLTGIIVQLEAAEDAQSKSLPEEAAEHLIRGRELARESLQEARRSVHALRPQALAGRSLCEAMRNLLEKMTRDTNLTAHLKVKGHPPVLLPEWEENLLRITQEALTNTLRHARANGLEMRLDFEPDRVVLELIDNGRGFEREKESLGYGLVGMKERADEMGGNFLVESKAGEGTKISVILPLAKPNQLWNT